MHNLFAMSSSPAPAALPRVDYRALSYSGRVRGNSRDGLLHSMLVGERVHRYSRNEIKLLS